MKGKLVAACGVLHEAGTAVIRGRVVAGDNGQALRKAQVRLAGAELREGRLANTDAEGRYEFKDLPAGRYTLTASKGSYAALQHGQLRAFEAGRPVDVRDGQTLDRIDFALPRGGVIAGRVLDKFGDPVMDVQVSAMRYQYVGGRKRLAPAGRVVTTNDIGEFRVFGPSPGQYYVSATLRDSMITVLASGMPPDATATGGGYAPTYYPNTTRIVEAQHVTVGLGQTMNDMFIALSPTRTARISGNVVDSQGKVVRAGAVMAMLTEHVGIVETTEFSMKELPLTGGAAATFSRARSLPPFRP